MAGSFAPSDEKLFNISKIEQIMALEFNELKYVIKEEDEVGDYCKSVELQTTYLNAEDRLAKALAEKVAEYFSVNLISVEKPNGCCPKVDYMFGLTVCPNKGYHKSELEEKMLAPAGNRLKDAKKRFESCNERLAKKVVESFFPQFG